ncbi:hypothetical protein IWQ56_003836, partial [Coemansia nantahalensis]
MPVAGFASSAVIDQLTYVLGAIPAEARKKEVAKTKAVYAFEVANSKGKKHYFVVDMKQNGTVTDGATEAEAAKGQPKPDISISLGDEALVKIAENKTTAVAEYMGGRVKIKGNMMLGMKLESLLARFKKLAADLPAAPAAPATAPAQAAAKSEDIAIQGYEASRVLAQIGQVLGADDKKREALFKSTNAVFQIDIDGPQGVKSWVLNLKPATAPAEVVLVGTAAQNKKAAGVTLGLKDADFVSLASGKITGQSAFTSGKLK